MGLQFILAEIGVLLVIHAFPLRSIKVTRMVGKEDESATEWVPFLGGAQGASDCEALYQYPASVEVLEYELTVSVVCSEVIFLLGQKPGEQDLTDVCLEVEWTAFEGENMEWYIISITC